MVNLNTRENIPKSHNRHYFTRLPMAGKIEGEMLYFINLQLKDSKNTDFVSILG